MRVSDGDDERAVLLSPELVDQLDLKEGDDLSISLQWRARHENKDSTMPTRARLHRRAQSAAM
jgi:hypothetical protein